jgi:hypothetical protein
MRTLRFLLTGLCAVAFVPLTAGAASAVAPDNDESTGAVVLNLGDTVQEDTTEATTTPEDEALNAYCGAPATNNSVWYQYSPSVNRTVVLDTSGSDYSTGLMVFQGTPTADSVVTCGPVAVGLQAEAGATYSVMAFSDTAVDGGNLVLSLESAPPPVMHMSLAKRGLAFHHGAAQVHGTYVCRHADDFAGVEAHLLQRAGRLKIQADSATSIRCDGARHRWSVRLVSQVGTYVRGRAVAKATIFGCGLVACAHQRVMHRIHLAWAASSQRGWVGHPTTGLTVPRPMLSTRSRWPARSW